MGCAVLSYPQLEKTEYNLTHSNIGYAIFIKAVETQLMRRAKWNFKSRGIISENHIKFCAKNKYLNQSNLLRNFCYSETRQTKNNINIQSLKLEWLEYCVDF